MDEEITDDDGGVNCEIDDDARPCCMITHGLACGPNKNDVVNHPPEQCHYCLLEEEYDESEEEM